MAPDDDKTHSHVLLTAGTMVSHYQIIEKIGAGGMGEVYLAEDTELNRKVALKFLSPHLCQDAECRARFKREAQAAAKLDHPNIVAVHEVGEFCGRPFFSMQHVEGQSLKDVIAGKTLPLDRIVEIGIQVCDGLQAAHENGITHRDIKPSNVLIDSHGRARIVDFGLASVVGSDHLTKTGSTLGTIGYMSPEQVRGETVDHRTDIFSLGVVLYELITCHSPFKSDTEAATLHAITDIDPEPLARFRRGTPQGLQAIIDKALDKKVATRYQHADDLQTDLARLKESFASKRGPRALSSRSALWLGSAAALLLLTAVTVLLLVRPWSLRPSASADKVMLAVLPFENLGNAEDEYFADGMTAEIIGKLSCVSGLGVISRQSVTAYKKTTKTTAQIGNELGAEYLLEGTIRYDKNSNPPAVRIAPELIRVKDNVHLWADQLDLPLANIFQAQAQIALNIATALDVRLVKGEPAWIERIPTQSTEAYKLLLRAYQLGGPTADAEQYGDSILAIIDQALAKDSSIVVAWALQACMHARKYHFNLDRKPERFIRAKMAAQRAVDLDPNAPEAHFALGEFHYCCERNFELALREYDMASSMRGSPWDPTSVISYALRRQGRFSEALDHLLDYFKLNPGRADPAIEIASTCTSMGEYAKADQFYQKAIALNLSGTDYIYAANNLLLWKGDLVASRTLLEHTSEQDLSVSTTWFGQYLLERNRANAIAFLDSLHTPVLSDQLAYYPISLCRAMIYWSLGGETPSPALLVDASQVLETRLQRSPDDYRLHVALGLAYALSGRRIESLRHADRAVEFYPINRDAYFGPLALRDRIVVLVIIGEYDRAIDELEKLLELPGRYTCISVPLLKIDPLYDSLRNNQRFQQLLAKYGT